MSGRPSQDGEVGPENHSAQHSESRAENRDFAPNPELKKFKYYQPNLQPADGMESKKRRPAEKTKERCNVG